MDMKHPTAFHREPDFIFAVSMFFVEFGKHLVQAWSLGRDINYVGGDIPSFFFEDFDLRFERFQNVFVAGV